MDSTNMAKIIMNPVRQRIVQYLILHDKATPGEIHKALSDVPQASLYRHIKVLLEAGGIEVLEEKKVRGTIERTYGLVKQPFVEEPGQQEIAAMIQTSLMSLMVTFQQYFAREGVDSKKDMLGFSTATLMLSDEEFAELMRRLGGVLSDYVSNEPGPERRPRRFTTISSPCEE